MGWESLVFVGSPSQLTSFFPGWKSALDAPITRTETNPFTNEPMTFVLETAEYGDDDAPPMECDWDRLREAAPPSIGQEISASALDQLSRALGLEGPTCRRALSEPPGSETIVLVIVPALVEALATTAPERHAALGRAMRADLDDEEAEALVARLVSLARTARATDARLYLVEQR